MSSFTPVNSVYGFAGSPPAPIPPEVKPPQGESTGAQFMRRRLGAWPGVGGETGGAVMSAIYGVSAMGGFGGTWGGYPTDVLNGGTVPGWRQGAQGSWNFPRRGFYNTYRLMSLNPTINLVKTLILSPIISSQWTFKKRDDRHRQDDNVPDKWVNLVADQLQPLRPDIMASAVRYLDFGFQAFEKVWEIVDGKYVLKKLKPLLPDLTYILDDYHGNYAGVTQNGGTVVTDGALGPDKSCVLTWNGEAGNPYGLSRHEAAYDAWTDWLMNRLKDQTLKSKISGILPIGKYRPGQTPITFNEDDSAKTYMDNAEIMKQILATVGAGNGVGMPSVDYELEELSRNPGLAKTTPWDLDFYDAGNYAPAMEGYIKSFEYLDKMLFRAWCRPERTGIEGQHAARADSKQHTENSDVDSEVIDDDIAHQLNTKVVDDILVLNFGEKARGKVYIKPAPLVDSKIDIFLAMLNGIMADPYLARTMIRGIDIDDMAEHLDIAVDPDVKGLNDLFAEPMPDEVGGAGDPSLATGVTPTVKTGDAGGQVGNNNGRGRRVTKAPKVPDAVALMSRVSRMLNGED